MSTTLEKNIVPILLSCLISLVVYIYVDYKSFNESQIKEIKTIINSVNSELTDNRIRNVEISSSLKSHDARIERIERKIYIK